MPSDMYFVNPELPYGTLRLSERVDRRLNGPRRLAMAALPELLAIAALPTRERRSMLAAALRFFSSYVALVGGRSNVGR